MNASTNHALVTGGGTGIGRAIAEALLRRGDRVSLLGRRLEVLQGATDELKQFGQVGAHQADVTDAASLDTAYAAAREAFGPVNTLVANAGAAGAGPFDKAGPEVWQQMVGVNLTGVYLSIRPLLEDLQNSAHGRIIVVASTAGLKGYAYTTAYSAAKHGAVGLVRALAQELAGTQVTVNAVCPGFTDTELADRAIAQIERTTGRSADEARAELLQFNPQGRMIQPDEVAETVLWLCSERAASVTGQAIPIAGGEL